MDNDQATTKEDSKSEHKEGGNAREQKSKNPDQSTASKEGAVKADKTGTVVKKTKTVASPKKSLNIKKEMSEKPTVEKANEQSADKSTTQIKEEQKAVSKQSTKERSSEEGAKPEETPAQEETKKDRQAKQIEKITSGQKKELTTEEGNNLRLIARMKKKKPRFVRQELGIRKKLADVWRKPKGIDSKQIEGKRGKGKLPATGYKKPSLLRGLHPTGYMPLLITNTRDLENLDVKKQAAVIAASVGRRARNQIIAAANQKKIVILNPRKGEI